MGSLAHRNLSTSRRPAMIRSGRPPLQPWAGRPGPDQQCPAGLFGAAHTGEAQCGIEGQQQPGRYPPPQPGNPTQNSQTIDIRAQAGQSSGGSPLEDPARCRETLCGACSAQCGLRLDRREFLRQAPMVSRTEIELDPGTGPRPWRRGCAVARSGSALQASSPDGDRRPVQSC